MSCLQKGKKIVSNVVDFYGCGPYFRDKGGSMDSQRAVQ